MHEQIVALDEDLAAHPTLGKVAQQAGTTATVVFLRDDTCFVACSGDSRAVLGVSTSAVLTVRNMSVDHRPDQRVEAARIHKAGGKVSRHAEGGAARSEDTQHGLAMSRYIYAAVRRRVRLTCGAVLRVQGQQL